MAVPIIPTGLILGQYFFVSEDNIDLDTDPQLVPVSGVVRFTASVKTLTMPASAAVVVPLVFECIFDNQGNLVPKQGNGVGVKLPATDSDEFTEQGWTWHVDFNLRVIETGHTVNIPGWDFQVPEGSTQDMSEIMPVDSSPGVLTVRGPAGINGTNGVDGAPGNATIRFATTAGRAAYLATGPGTEQLIYGDTGWRDITSLLINGWTGTIRIRRTGYDVKLQITQISAAAATSGTFVIAPVGFQLGITSIGNFRGFVFQNSTPITMRGVNISSSAAVAVTQHSTSDVQVLGTFEWSTNEAWPTTLPGTAVGVIPTS